MDLKKSRGNNKVSQANISCKFMFREAKCTCWPFTIMDKDAEKTNLTHLTEKKSAQRTFVNGILQK